MDLRETSSWVTWTEARRRRSKPDRRLVRSDIEVLKQRGEVVMTLSALNFFLCRPVEGLQVDSVAG